MKSAIRDTAGRNLALSVETSIPPRGSSLANRRMRQFAAFQSGVGFAKSTNTSRRELSQTCRGPILVEGERSHEGGRGSRGGHRAAAAAAAGGRQSVGAAARATAELRWRQAPADAARRGERGALGIDRLRDDRRGDGAARGTGAG